MLLTLAFATPGPALESPSFRLSARTVSAAFEAATQEMIQESASGGPEIDPSFGDAYSAAHCTWTKTLGVAECRLKTRHFRGPERPITNKFKQLDQGDWIALWR